MKYSYTAHNISVNDRQIAYTIVVAQDYIT
jgi:hypothetical protein